MGTFLHRTYVRIPGRPQVRGKFGLRSASPRYSGVLPGLARSFLPAICRRRTPRPLGLAPYFSAFRRVAAARRLAWQRGS